MSDEQPTLVGTTLGERYRVVREVGHGAMGTVYEARHPLIGRRFAIKVLHRSCSTPSQRERFLHEARAAGAISHPNIVQVQDFGVAPGGAPYLVMEYVDGIDLQSHLEKQGALPVGDALEICSQMLSALEVIHGAGLVHRDIKPANIMLARGGRSRLFAKLLDFGIVRAINPLWQRPDLTRVDQVLGTPAYLSPEQAVGGQPDPRWDLWALGTILYELVCGKLPFRLETLQQVTDDIINGRLVPLSTRRSDLPPWLYQVIDRAHHPNQEQRYRTATSFLQALEMQSARPGGDERTVPFLRVDLQTPPPQLVARLVGSGDAEDFEDKTVREGPRAKPSPRAEPEPTEPWPLEQKADEGSATSGPAIRPPPARRHDSGAADLVEPVGLSVDDRPSLIQSMDVPLPSSAHDDGDARSGPEPAGRLRRRRPARRLRARRLVASALVLLALSAAVAIYLLVTR